jgi:hypothetical protein
MFSLLGPSPVQQAFERGSAKHSNWEFLKQKSDVPKLKLVN